MNAQERITKLQADIRHAIQSCKTSETDVISGLLEDALEEFGAEEIQRPFVALQGRLRDMPDLIAAPPVKAYTFVLTDDEFTVGAERLDCDRRDYFLKDADGQVTAIINRSKVLWIGVDRNGGA